MVSESTKSLKRKIEMAKEMHEYSLDLLLLPKKDLRRIDSRNLKKIVDKLHRMLFVERFVS